ncbi:endonuclease/exonuclease/phosphatase family protein [Prescottella subtropica]|uniref:endonuclease/exonuclease/phosphatase family protein n=1 Tax=Prescottella subtropica TaxID=2545757 RepID=UPI0010F9F6B1|nr:endonuclease/exonuclease/phosphatase family protein [Prescottella subtropica]
MTNGLTRRQALKILTAGTAAVGVGALATAAPAGARPGPEIRVLSLNTWHGGAKITNGADRIVDLIRSTRASIVLLSEAGDTTAELATRLAAQGLHFEAATSSDTGILSAFPIVETGKLDYMVKAVVTVDDLEIAVYAAHLEYRWYATYLPRGYGGGHPSGEFSEFGWNKLPGGPVTDADTVLRVNAASGRPAVIEAFLADAAAEQQKGRQVLMGGDFNEPSHLDWAADTRDLYDHHGVVVPWQSTRLLEAAGFVDAYRATYPSAVTHPGFTWPSDNPNVAVSDLTWAPDADERDRIDYVFAGPGTRLRLQSAGIVGPRETIVRSERVAETSRDNFVASPTPWPTDHKAVLATYRCLPASGGFGSLGSLGGSVS